MGDLRDLLRAALDGDEGDKETFEALTAIHEDTFGKAKARAVYDASIEWTVHEFFAYSMNVLGPKNLEACEKAGKLLAELRDTLVANATYDSPKMPGINYFQSLDRCKEPQ